MKKIITLILLLPSLCFANLDKWNALTEYLQDIRESKLEALDRPFYTKEDRERFENDIILITRILNHMVELENQVEYYPR